MLLFVQFAEHNMIHGAIMRQIWVHGRRRNRVDAFVFCLSGWLYVSILVHLLPLVLPLNTTRTNHGNKLKKMLARCGPRYAEANAGRNPFRGTEYWVIPMMIAFASYVARWIADLSCSA